MGWDDGLSGVLYEIAASAHPRIGVLAGPGTGKTSLGLMRRVARLLETGVCAPEQILVLTFTRTAALDLVQKMSDLGVPGADRVVATTIHSYCLTLLQREAVLAATGRATRILLEHERDLLLRDLNGAFGTLRQRRDLLNAFEAGWDRRQSDHPGAATAPTDVSFSSQVLRWLREHRAMLIGEVVPIAFAYLMASPQAVQRSQYRHVLVDEYQDLNLLEQSLVELLVGPNASVFVVGDDDQSIYRFRFANPDGIQLFVGGPTTQPYAIHECLRCPPEVVAIANSLVDASGSRSKPPLVSTSKTHAQISIVQWLSIDEEVAGIATAVVGDIAGQHREAGEFLILTNRRRIGYEIRTALRNLGVVAHSYFQDNALKSSPSAQQSLALVRLLVDEDDRPSYRVWLAAGDAAGRRDAYGRVRSEVGATGQPARAIVQGIVARTSTISSPSLAAREVELQKRLGVLATMDLDQLVEILFPNSDPEQTLMRELADVIRVSSSTPAELLSGILAGLTQPEVPQRPDFVRVMSLHKSKGLTSKVVIVAGAVDGVIPTIDAGDPPDEQEAAFAEQRRLFFVAVTRASEELVISYPMAVRVAEAFSMGVRTGVRRRQGTEWWARTMPTPYAQELGPTSPAPVSGDLWLGTRA